MKNIDVIIIGSQKAGTSSLNNYLAKHPDFITHGNLEFGYFISEEVHAKGFEVSFNEHFPHFVQGKKIIAKSVGIMYMEEALQRLRSHNPAIRIIVTLRNPIDRAYSAYWYARRLGWEKSESFEKAILEKSGNHVHWIATRTCDYLQRSQYVTHLHNVYKYFAREQVCIVMAEDLKSRTEETCNEIMKYFGYSSLIKLGTEIDFHNRSALPQYSFVSTFLSDQNPIKKHLRAFVPLSLGRRIKKQIKTLNEKEFIPPKLSLETRKELIEYFKPFNTELEGLIEKDLNHWNV